MCDGNFHLMARLPALRADGEEMLQVVVYPLVRDRGGSISARHGIDTIKRAGLSFSRTEVELAVMRGIMMVFDLWAQINPGKLLPSP